MTRLAATANLKPIVGGAFQRCSNPNNPRYADYGGRGIEYRLPRNFHVAARQLLAAIGPRPEGMTLDRCDNDGHYEIGNLRWATPAEQQANRRPGHSAKTHCPQGHAYDEANTRTSKDGARHCRACESREGRVLPKAKRVPVGAASSPAVERVRNWRARQTVRS